MPGVTLGTGESGMNKRVPVFRDLPTEWEEEQTNNKYKQNTSVIRRVMWTL